MPTLPEFRRTPVRGRHPLVYLAAFSLLFGLIAFIARIGVLWVATAVGLAVVMAVGAIVIALRVRSPSA